MLSVDLVGLDIGHSTIKMAALEFVGDRAKLASFALMPTPQNVFRADGEIIDPPAVARVIQLLRKRLALPRSRVVAGVPGTLVRKVPWDPNEDALEQADMFVPMEIHRAHIGYSILSHRAQGTHALLTAVCRNVVVGHEQAAELASLRCTAMEANGIAVARTAPTLKGATTVVVDVGAKKTTVVALRNGEVEYLREVDLGGNTYTEAIREHLGLSFEEAEGLQRDRRAKAKLEKPLRTVHEELCTEIQTSIDFATVSAELEPAERVWVTGGGSKVPGFEDRLRADFPCERLDPLANVDVNPEMFDAETLEHARNLGATALGLAHWRLSRGPA
jgi:type IV pilus assembly protein PilM